MIESNEHLYDLEVWQLRTKELIREAGEARLAKRLRARRRKSTSNKATAARWAFLMATLVVVALMLSSGIALAVNQINCASLQQDPQTPECFGTSQSDVIEGRDVMDIIYANGSTDEVNAGFGDDEVYGGAGRDGLDGWGDDDKLYGGDDADVITDISLSIDTDELRGGAGNDTLDANDSDFADTLVCGPGDNDAAYFDRAFIGLMVKQDTVSDSCENLHPNGQLD